eukprot:jgi/Tetstr1/448225/TSEL_035513.t1
MPKAGEFEIVERSAFAIEPPEFLCDRPICKQIVAPLPSRPFFMAIIGSAGSGKTSLMINMLTSRKAYQRAFHRVHVVMPPHSVASLKNNPFEEHERMYGELDFDTLAGIREGVREAGDTKKNSLLILDDVTVALKDLDVQRDLKDLIYNRRHYRLSIIILVQSYIAMPLPIRKSLSHFAMFKPRNKKEYEAIFSEIISMDRAEAERMMRFVYDDQFAFLFADVERGQFFKKTPGARSGTAAAAGPEPFAKGWNTYYPTHAPFGIDHAYGQRPMLPVVVPHNTGKPLGHAAGGNILGGSAERAREARGTQTEPVADPKVRLTTSKAGFGKSLLTSLMEDDKGATASVDAEQYEVYGFRDLQRMARRRRKP